MNPEPDDRLLPSCVGCGYALEGLQSQRVCPECGVAISRSVAYARMLKWDLELLRAGLFRLAVFNAIGIAAGLALVWQARMEPADRLLDEDQLAGIAVAAGFAIVTAGAWAWKRIANAMRADSLGAQGASIQTWVVAGLLALALYGFIASTKEFAACSMCMAAPFIAIRGGYVLLLTHRIASTAFPAWVPVAAVIIVPWCAAIPLGVLWPPLSFTGWAAHAVLLASAARRIKPTG